MSMGSASPHNVAASGQVITGGGIIRAFVLTPAAAAATLTLYDNTAGSGTVLGKLQAAASGSSPVVSLPGGLPFGKGVYAVLTGAGASADVYA